MRWIDWALGSVWHDDAKMGRPASHTQLLSALGYPLLSIISKQATYVPRASAAAPTRARRRRAVAAAAGVVTPSIAMLGAEAATVVRVGLRV
jgi:hypothetical protein